MGFFRRYKLTDYTADECQKEMFKCATFLANRMWCSESYKQLDRWACFRELLARHEKKNKSPLDEK